MYIRIYYKEVRIEDYVIPLYDIESITTKFTPGQKPLTLDSQARKIAIARGWIPDDVTQYSIWKGTTEEPDKFIFKDITSNRVVGKIPFSEINVPDFTRAAYIKASAHAETLHALQTGNQMLFDKGISFDYHWGRKDVLIQATNQHLFNISF